MDAIDFDQSAELYRTSFLPTEDAGAEMLTPRSTVRQCIADFLALPDEQRDLLVIRTLPIDGPEAKMYGRHDIEQLAERINARP